MTNRQALIRIQAIQSWRRLPLAKDGKPYGPGFFLKRDWEGSLSNENRRVTFRLRDKGKCLGCGKPLPVESVGDHLIPRSEGGPDGAQNYLPLCRSCNSSKGKRDLIQWWVESEKKLEDLPEDALCAYARQKYAWCGRRGNLEADAPSVLERIVQMLSEKLPPKHREVVGKLDSRKAVYESSG